MRFVSSPNLNVRVLLIPSIVHRSLGMHSCSGRDKLGSSMFARTRSRCFGSGKAMWRSRCKRLDNSVRSFFRSFALHLPRSTERPPIHATLLSLFRQALYRGDAVETSHLTAGTEEARYLLTLSSFEFDKDVASHRQAKRCTKTRLRDEIACNWRRKLELSTISTSSRPRSGVPTVPTIAIARRTAGRAV